MFFLLGFRIISDRIHIAGCERYPLFHSDSYYRGGNKSVKKNNKKQYPNQKKVISPIIQNYQEIVLTLPILGEALWTIGGFFLFAYLIVTGSPVMAVIALLATLSPIYKALRKG